MPQSRIVVIIGFTVMVAATSFAQMTQPPPTPPATSPSTPPTDTPQTQGTPALTQKDKDEIAKLLNEAIVKGQEHPFRIVCSATSLTCTPASVFISAASISDIEIKDIPATTKKLTVRVTAGESDASGPIIVRRVFDPKSIPDRIIVTVNKARRYKPTYSSDGYPEAEWNRCPTTLLSVSSHSVAPRHSSSSCR